VVRNSWPIGPLQVNIMAEMSFNQLLTIAEEITEAYNDEEMVTFDQLEFEAGLTEDEFRAWNLLNSSAKAKTFEQVKESLLEAQSEAAWDRHCASWY
jgi:hypothetical protein